MRGHRNQVPQGIIGVSREVPGYSMPGLGEVRMHGAWSKANWAGIGDITGDMKPLG